MRYLVKVFRISIRQACFLFNLSTSVYYYKPVESQDEEITEALDKIVEENSDWGFWKIYKHLKNTGTVWNHKRVYRVYTDMKLNIRRKRKKRLPARIKAPLVLPTRPNLTWSMDFMQDTLVTGVKFRTLNIIDDFNREVLCIAIDTSIKGKRVVNELTKLIMWRGKPDVIRVDNGPEFISEDLKRWARKNEIKILYIQPGKPMQNSYIERFNRSYRKGVLDKYLFENLEQVRILTGEWMWKYNNIRIHDSLLDLTPRQFLLKYGKVKDFPTFQQDINIDIEYQKFYNFKRS